MKPEFKTIDGEEGIKYPGKEWQLNEDRYDQEREAKLEREIFLRRQGRSWNQR